MQRIATYLFDSMFQSEKRISNKEKVVVISATFLFILASAILIAAVS